MKVLAIETSCDETAVAVIEGRGESIAVLSNIISSQVKLHAKYGGVVPNLAAREHTKNIAHVFRTALKEAGIPVPLARYKLQAKSFPIDLIAVTHGPGLGPSLLVGITFARTLAWLTGLPIVGVNHLDGHIHSNWLEPEKPMNDVFPALNLIVSGGHTELVLMRGHGDYKIIGETRDDAVGEAFDKVARLLGLGYPGGPVVSKLAEQGDPAKYSLPSPMLNSKNYDFSYSGLKTAVLYLIRDLTKGSPSAGSGLSVGLTNRQKSDIAASFQEAAIRVLVEKTKRAAQKHGVKAVLLSGGVSANKLLRHRLEQMAAELGIRSVQPAMKYTTDNAAMIAAAGYFASLKRKRAKPSWKSVRMDANLTL